MIDATLLPCQIGRADLVLARDAGESGRPFAPGAEDGFPVTTFHPRRGIGGYNFLHATINDVGDLREYFTRLYAGGYYPPRNHAWNMPSLRDDSAVKVQLVNIFQNRKL